jgi:hypothetical protein
MNFNAKAQRKPKENRKNDRQDSLRLSFLSVFALDVFLVLDAPA